MLRSDGIYREDNGAWSKCMLLRQDGSGVHASVSFGVLTHEAARLAVTETGEFQLMSWKTAIPPRMRSRAELTWVGTADTVELRWTLKWTMDGKSGETPMCDLGAIQDDGRLLRLSFQRPGQKPGPPRDSHFQAVDPRALGDDWGPEDDARLVRERLESGKASRDGVQLAAALGYEPAAIASGGKPIVVPDRTQVVAALANLGGSVAVRGVLGMVWDEGSQVRFNQGFAYDVAKGSAEHRAMLAVAKWLQSGKDKDLAKAKEVAGKLDEFPDELLEVLALGPLTGAELEKSLNAFLASFINKSEEQAFAAMRTSLLPWVLEGRDRYA